MADLFRIGLSGIATSQAHLATTGHNIANVNTKGYNRQSVEVVTAGADRVGNFFVGRGAQISNIERAFDKFAYREHLTNTTSFNYNKVAFEQNSQLDMVLSDESTSATKSVLSMFKTVNGVADHPNMLEARKVFLESAKNMSAQYNRLSEQLQIQYSGVNKDIANTGDTLTTLADNLAQINGQILAAVGGSDSRDANDLRDQRDELIRELSELVSVSVVELDNQMVNVYVGSGQALVMGSDSMKIVSTNGNPDPSRKELAIEASGNILLMDGAQLGGKVASLFDFRDDLERSFNQLGQNAIGLAHAINEQNKEGQGLDKQIGGNIFNDVNSQSAMENRVLSHSDNLGSAKLTVQIEDLGELTPDEFGLTVAAYTPAAVGPPTVTEKVQFTLTNKTTGATQTIPAVGQQDLSLSKRVDVPGLGFSIGVDSIIAAPPLQVGKEFTLRPTRQGAQDLNVDLEDPRKIAAADAGIKVVKGAGNTGGAELKVKSIDNRGDVLYPSATSPLTIQVVAGATPGVVAFEIKDANGVVVTVPAGGSYNLTDDAGAPVVKDALPLPGDTLNNLGYSLDLLTGKQTISVAGITIEFEGTPAVGDTFNLNFNETGDGDNRNMLKIADFQSEKIMNGGKSTFIDVYSGMVSEVGARTANADVAMQSSQTLTTQSFERIQSLSGVNMDEEAANLMRFQQSYSAAARVITVASELFDTILQAAR